MNSRLRDTLIAGGLIIALAFALISAFPRSVDAESPEQRLISVTGEAKMQVKPDLVYG